MIISNLANLLFLVLLGGSLWVQGQRYDFVLEYEGTVPEIVFYGSDCGLGCPLNEVRPWTIQTTTDYERKVKTFSFSQWDECLIIVVRSDNYYRVRGVSDLGPSVNRGNLIGDTLIKMCPKEDEEPEEDPCEQSVYPNPTYGKLYWDCEGRFTILDQWGRVMAFTREPDLSDTRYPAGTYYILHGRKAFRIFKQLQH